MPASYRSIDYSLRPGKHAERKMISEALRKLHPFGAVESYRYVGMGSLWFSDFSHFHKSLGIRNMISIEREASHRTRFEFNKPVSSIELMFEDTSTALPKIDWSVRSIVWLDYDDQMARPMLEDVRAVAASAAPGTVLIVSVQTESPPTIEFVDSDGEQATKSAGSVQELRDAYGAGPVPQSASDGDLQGWALAKLVRQMLKTTIEDALATRNNGRPAQQKIAFKPFASFEYADGAKMTTICGAFIDGGQLHLLASCAFDQLPFFQDGDDATRLVVPILTPREIKMLEAKLPDGPVATLGGNIVPGRDANAFASFYRYLPSFAPLDS